MYYIICLFSQPPFSVIRFMGMMSVGYFFASLVQFAIPVEPMFEIDWNFLNILVPLPCAIGMHCLFYLIVMFQMIFYFRNLQIFYILFNF